MNRSAATAVKVVMLLSNPFNPDDRVRNEALVLIELGYQVILLAWDREGKFPELEMLSGLEIRRMPLRAGYGQGLGKILQYLQVWRWFVKEITLLQPDVVHCHDFDTYLAGVWYAWFHRRVKLILDAHENYYMMMKPLVSQLGTGVVRLLERWLTRRADLLISANKATAEYYKNQGARKAVVVGNWKDPRAYQFDLSVLTKKYRELGIDGKLVIAYIGALSAERNVLPLIQAVRSRPWAFLILGGKGDQENEIRSACLQLSNVYFPGYIHPDDIPLITATADVIYYGFDPDNIYAPYNAPNKLYEALAAGKPVLAGDIGGELSSVVNSTQCGILLPKVNRDSIGAAIDSLADKSIRAPMEAQSREAGLITYNWAIAKQRLISAYSSLLSGERKILQNENG